MGASNVHNPSDMLRIRLDGTIATISELATKAGTHGVLRKTTLKDYQEGLSNFKNINIERTLLPSGKLSPY